ncbi:hypothetical protein ACHHYP_20647 [Achlya hypogyna]|uniref:Uncharacterized protein n=1 Tax=Achlya hypogyna TaxID=1202772 RepID=A0A1V9YG99_ACHHY|nr:hypothetical protein ACHHYP_20647 [Achlya hypogyna]
MTDTPWGLAGWVKLTVTQPDVPRYGPARRWLTLGLVRGHPILFVAHAPRTQAVGGIRLAGIAHMSLAAADVFCMELQAPEAPHLRATLVHLETSSAAIWFQAILVVQSMAVPSDCAHMTEAGASLLDQLDAALDDPHEHWISSIIASATIQVAVLPTGSCCFRITITTPEPAEIAMTRLAAALDIDGHLGHVFGHAAFELFRSTSTVVVEANYRFQGMSPRQTVLLRSKSTTAMAFKSLGW